MILSRQVVGISLFRSCAARTSLDDEESYLILTPLSSLPSRSLHEHLAKNNLTAIDSADDLDAVPDRDRGHHRHGPGRGLDGAGGPRLGGQLPHAFRRAAADAEHGHRPES